MKTKILALICAVLMLISVFGVTSFAAEDETVADTTQTEETTENKTQQIFNLAENDLAKLDINLETANLIITDKATGQIWTAFPQSDEITESSIYSAMLNVTYLSGNGIEAIAQAPGNNVGFEIYEVDNGVKIVFIFSGETTNFSVPLIVTLKDNYIEAYVDYAEVTEEGTSQVTSVEVLPNLFYGKNTENGYIFIPDGSGAIVNYSDSLSKTATYSAQVYGEDLSQNLIDTKLSDAKNALMPVYGAVKNDSALFGIITRGDLYATINADMASDCATASASFVYRECDLTGIQSATGGQRTLTITQKKPLKITPTVRFYMLSGDKANYSAMANTYRDYLTNNKALGKKVDESPASVSVMAYGAVPEKKTVFGFPITSIHDATTFSDLESLYADLTKDGGSIPSFYLYGFLGGGYGSKTVTNTKYISALGGQKGYDAFTKLVGKDNVYTVYDLERCFGRSFDFLRFNDYMSSLNQTIVRHHYTLSSTGRWNTELGSWTFYSVDYQKKLNTKLLKSLSKNKNNIVLEHYGNDIISDFKNTKNVSRSDYFKFVSKAIEMYEKKDVNVALDGGNACTATLADEIYDIPLEASGNALESYSVPFYTMVYHGYQKLSSSPVNLYGNSEELALRAFEQGISASYAVTGCDPHELRSTKFNFLYNSQIKNLLPKMQKYSNAYKNVHSILADKKIIKHEYVGDVSVTTYENGWRIACNYGDEDAVFEQQTIKSLNYIVLK